MSKPLQKSPSAVSRMADGLLPAGSVDAVDEQLDHVVVEGVVPAGLSRWKRRTPPAWLTRMRAPLGHRSSQAATIPREGALQVGRRRLGRPDRRRRGRQRIVVSSAVTSRRWLCNDVEVDRRPVAVGEILRTTVPRTHWVSPT